MTLFFDTFSTPVGSFSVGCNAAGALLTTAFGDLAVLQQRLNYPRRSGTPDSRLEDPGSIRFQRDAELARAAREQVRAYFAGERFTFQLLLAPVGSCFQQQVWSALAQIPYGETRTYGQLAAALGMAGGARAVGRANAANPLCLVVPCHRVIGADGSLTGFAFGHAIKRQLLDHERAHADRADAPHMRGSAIHHAAAFETEPSGPSLNSRSSAQARLT